MPHFMIVLIPYIYLLNLFLDKQCLFLRVMEPLKCETSMGALTGSLQSALGTSELCNC